MFREMTQTSNVAMDNDQIMINAPSVFATAPHAEVSDRYGFMSTIKVVDALRTEGWLPVDATQKNVRDRNVRDRSKRELTKHLVRFRRLDDEVNVGDSVVELVLTNSHDRSSAFVLHAGLFRMVCANGIVIADSTFNKLSVRHGKNVVGEIIEGSYDVIEDVPMLANEVETMQNIELSGEERAIFAKSAYNYAFGEDDNMVTDDNRIVNQMLRPVRTADTGHDLWTTFNVIQEHVLRGGIHTVKKSKTARRGYRQSTSRAVKSIDKNIKLNKALWSLASEMKSLKTA